MQFAMGKFNSRKKKGVLGDTVYQPKKIGPQQFVYVTGFWFPNKKQALSSTSLTASIYEKRRKEGTLGDLVSPKRKSNSTVLTKPCYFKGFWFPTVFTASEIFNMKPETVRQRILRGSFEECCSTSSLSVERYSYNFLYNNEV